MYIKSSFDMVPQFCLFFLQISSEDSSEMIPDLFSSLSSDSCQADDEFECDCGHCLGSMPGDNDNVLDLDWQTADGLESSAREENSSPSV